MQLAAHELQDLHELTLSCVNSLVNMGHFIQYAQDQELKSLLQQHLPFHIRDYNKKVECMGQRAGSQAPFTVPDLNQSLQSLTTIPAPQPITPTISGQTPLGDREIATAYLLTLKRAGREYAWAAMEMANPEVRLFLEDAFRMCSHHAYDIWQWMVKHGFYPLQPAPEAEVRIMSSMYNMVPEQVGALPS